MKICEMLGNIKFQLVQGSLETDVSNLCYDSRKVSNGSAFVCIKGLNSDGHDYVQRAVEMGASVIVAEHTTEAVDCAALILVKDSREALAVMSAAWFGNPAAKLKTIGITGTKGKTTTSYMVYSILKSAGRKCGLMGTIETIIGDEHIHASNTTPESYILQEYLARMVAAGCEYVVMEVSSQGLKQNRVSGFVFDIGVFMNLEPDHIAPGEHESFEEYLMCKSLLFKKCVVGIGNADDPHIDQIMEGHTCILETFGMCEGADLRASEVSLHIEGGGLAVRYVLEGLLDFPVKVNIPGKFTVYNSLAAIAICRHLNVPWEAVCSALLNISVKGRVEPVKISDKFTLMIDYAHNAMALRSLLTTIREYNPGRLVCLFGCGGNRSRDRRFEMGEVSSRLADMTIVTSDNPRFEKPEEIIADILTGVNKGPGNYVAIIDRKDAIRYAIVNAEPGDVIILAGKGHEDYQEICGEKHPMDERVLIKEILDEMTPQEKERL